MSKTDKLARTPGGGMTIASGAALDRPDFIKAGDVRGTEAITMADIRPPALRIAQAMSPEVKRSEAAYIDGLREGDFFNSITHEIYGEGPLELYIVNQLGHRHVEFAPMNEGGGVIDFAVPDGDPRTEFRSEERDGKLVRLKPRATKFYDYLVLVVLAGVEGALGRHEFMTFSLKSTQLKKATTLNTILLGSKLPSFAHEFAVSPVPEKRGTYSYYGWKIEPKGWVKDESIYNECADLFEKTKGKTVVVDAETVDADDAGDGPREKAPF